jgi:uncharacterized protein YPO0396
MHIDDSITYTVYQRLPAFLRGATIRVRLLYQQLARSLTKILYMALSRLSIQFVGNLIQIDRSFVGKVMEHIMGGLGFRATLLVPENKVDPVVEVMGDVFGF